MAISKHPVDTLVSFALLAQIHREATAANVVGQSLIKALETSDIAVNVTFKTQAELIAGLQELNELVKLIHTARVGSFESKDKIHTLELMNGSALILRMEAAL